MNNRRYNIYFHTHTVSGIIICALLYVMFFAGSFAFFKDDLSAWQKNRSHLVMPDASRLDFQSAIDTLALKHQMKGRDLEFFLQKDGENAYISMFASHDTTIKKKLGKTKSNVKRKRGRRGRGGDDDTDYLAYNLARKRSVDYEAGYDIGEFLYRLHFFAQLNVIPLRLGTPFGYLLAGIVSFIFLFALITGLMLHWDKVVSNFFTFRPWTKWKTVWTDMHTALGVIGFPFQLLYAITGIVLIANFFLLAPFTKYRYHGDTPKIYHELGYTDSTQYQYAYQPLEAPLDLNQLIERASQKWPGCTINKIQIKNYGDANMHVIIEAKPAVSASFTGGGKIIYRVRDHRVRSEVAPTGQVGYVNQVKNAIYHLHFGDFGGRPVRVSYFAMGAIGCLVVISGVLIWLVARDKNNVMPRKRAFNLWTANIFMAICLSMLPVTAFTMTCLIFMDKPTQQDVYRLYFYAWLVLSVYFIGRRQLRITNHQTLILSAVFCMAVPAADALKRGNWFWSTFSAGASDILFVDVLFFCLALVNITVLLKMSEQKAKNDHMQKTFN
ncbi:PepSY domain-containing protein [Mucilaginibacter sp. 21P]|uniref:PepSY-associated TM helix domain-containing protein n=1 Tax=Mucilaginibacter sp. 21P TaxID=2778902 RepID=UPI001C59EE3E|nr:PepSY-associated TM helix domain-containing protein [Mucilaginibacter sp. 21P]QXV63821.1 PepSY domain-containing protein [Mucilaginibacter sp. 21P]